MVNLKEYAQEVEDNTFKSIADLERINTNVEMHESEVIKAENGDEFTYMYFFDEDNVKIRVPKSVAQQLKTQMEANPKLEAFKVSKKGEGKKTEYTVIPL